MEDGTPPPDPVVVQITCDGMLHGSANTDTKGNFSANLGGNTVAASSDISGDISRQVNGDYTAGSNCVGAEIQARLAGYRSDVVILGNRRYLDNSEIGTLVLHRLSGVEGLTVSATSLMAPKDALKAFAKGREDATKRKWPEAAKEFEKAVAIYPKYAAAWLELGNALLQQNDSERARKSYAQALAADPKFVTPYLQLASMAAKEKHWQEVADNSDHLLRLNPVDFPQAWFFKSIANYYLGNRDQAEKSAREGIAHDPAHQFPQMSYLLGEILAQKHDFGASAESLRDYLHHAPHGPDADQVKKKLAEVERAAVPEGERR